MIHIKYFCQNPFQERCSVAWDENMEGIIVDPGFYNKEERDELYDFIKSKNLNIKYILLTHAHLDHIFGADEAASFYNVPIFMHKVELVTLKENNPYLSDSFGFPLPSIEQSRIRFIKEGDKIVCGSLEFEVIETPGHTMGGVCYIERNEKILFSGDTLFAGSIGRTDHRWADYNALMDSLLNKLMMLEGDIDVVPGHGPITSIAEERMTNPFLLPFNEPYEDYM